jgi:histone H3/H4
VFVYGAPLEVPRRADREAMERLREALERALLELTERAEDLAAGRPVGHTADAAP